MPEDPGFRALVDSNSSFSSFNTVQGVHMPGSTNFNIETWRYGLAALSDHLIFMALAFSRCWPDCTERPI
jgi:hypothetical protein